MLKKTFFQIHWFLGITAGLILSIMGVTGAIYSYEQPLQKWWDHESFYVQAENKAKLTPAEIYQHFQTVSPEIKINSITVSKEPTETTTVNIVKEGARKGYNMMVNPYNAEVLPDIQSRKFFMFIQDIHRTLTAGEVGKQITGASTLMLLFFIFSGIYLRWPKKHSLRQWFAVKPQLKGRNFIWDLHAVVGTWVVIFYLILACTGLFWSYDWWRSGMFKVLGVERPQPTLQEGRPQGRNNPSHNNDQHQLNNSNQTVSSRANIRSEQKIPEQNEHSSHAEKTSKRGLSPEQINTALTASWTAVNTKLERDYSLVTFTIPKKMDGKLEISFADVIPQHERARNKATYDYQKGHFEKLDLYADKKLNEKIMSSMLPVHRGSFFGPIIQFLVMLAALTMPLFFITGWMLYLKRRKQKKLTQQAREITPLTDIDSSKSPWLVVYASQTGVSEQLAWRTAASLQEAHQPASVKAIQQLSINDLQQNSQILFVVSTYGTGEAPDLASGFVKRIMSQRIDLKHLNYAVLALGSKEYSDSYCYFGHQLDDWLKDNGAHALYDLIEVDNANTADIQKWNSALAEYTDLELQSMSIEKIFDEWIMIKRELLNPDSLGAPAYNLEFTASHETAWKAGDIAEIQPGNSSNRIKKFLEKHNIAAESMINSFNLPIQDVLWDKDLTVNIEPYNNLDELIQQLPTLPSREYSIASIPSQQILRLVVRQQIDDTGELGLGSGWLTAHVQLQDRIALRIRSNESFHCIEDDRPVICIGNGTGIAGLMSILSERIEYNHTNNWLIFGERQQEHDYFFKATVQAWQNTAMIKRLDLAFSRDQAEKVYVHHKLRENAEILKQWIGQGAVIYVCGSIKGMATDVDQALNDILTETVVEDLKQTGRYRRDVY
ncbi:PepSY domain-containing protein [Acinetobacter stercoris]|uniref:Sulfite reductase [NADPH] flavoprotein alpha-component n=1 Tax=Acinetobacter stercoris TaxID=2126983 RepID=A0A2U3N040_9GAMM|nr:sulfite reductase flavoprotein subunit alpha [Acinetobacter stercoris]SPL71038.1 Sulfite reductase [NADPH] flavoprotein alpha-component [Acinetobacter stercoris]